MSRLLFAAARGARIQFLACVGFPEEWYKWTQIERLPIKETPTYRIHPDDAHLQYGPISSALREMAVAPEATLSVFSITYAKLDFWYSDCHGYSICDDELHRSLFLLILAEALADEGL